MSHPDTITSGVGKGAAAEAEAEAEAEEEAEEEEEAEVEAEVEARDLTFFCSMHVAVPPLERNALAREPNFF